MGAWGVLAFDNDEACDWASDLDDVDDLSLVDSAFTEVEGDEDMHAHDACNALAACEVLARLRGKPGYSNPYTEQVDAWVAAHPIVPPPEILARAIAIIYRVLREKSELRELWGDAGDDAGWRESVADLCVRLVM
jgi:hypothetical protein